MENGNAAIVLFGKTGAGKSTLGNMLYAHRPDPENGFTAGGNIRGVTSGISERVGCGWRVFDSVGMGEAEGGSVSNEDAVLRLSEFLKGFRREFLHVVYVARKGRFDMTDMTGWIIFKDIFAGCKSNFVVVFTHADDAWVRSNMDEIKKCYSGCEKFIGVDFPPIEGDERLEVIYSERRLEAIGRLEGTLGTYNHRAVRPEISRLTNEELYDHARFLVNKFVQYVRSSFRDFSGSSFTRIFDYALKLLF